MHFDFAAILVGLTFLTGVIWAIDHWFFAKRRAAEMPPGEAPREPILVDRLQEILIIPLADIRRR